MENSNLVLEIDVRVVDADGNDKSEWINRISLPLQVSSVSSFEMSELTEWHLIYLAAVFRENELLHRLLTPPSKLNLTGHNESDLDKILKLSYWPTYLQKKK